MRVRNGYTLLEVLMAMVILAIILPALIIFVTSSRRTRHDSFVAETATAIAQRSLDSLGQIPRGNRLTAPASATTLNHQGRDYNLSWRFDDPNNPYGGTKPGLVHVLVEYRVGNADHQTSLDGVLP